MCKKTTRNIISRSPEFRGSAPRYRVQAVPPQQKDTRKLEKRTVPCPSAVVFLFFLSEFGMEKLNANPTVYASAAARKVRGGVHR